MVSEAKIEKVECSRLLRNRHSVGESNYHFQFTPNFRGAAFLPKEVRNLCKKAFEEKALLLGVTIYCVNFGPDHCHLFVGNCRNYSVSDLVKHFKGYSAYILILEFPAACCDWDGLRKKQKTIPITNALWN